MWIFSTQRSPGSIGSPICARATKFIFSPLTEVRGNNLYTFKITWKQFRISNETGNCQIVRRKNLTSKKHTLLFLIIIFAILFQLFFFISYKILFSCHNDLGKLATKTSNAFLCCNKDQKILYNNFLFGTMLFLFKQYLRLFFCVQY